MQSKRVKYTKLIPEDVKKPCQELALYLLGKILVRKLEDGTVLKGRIVETESYLGGEDKASHSYNNRQTPACEPMYMPAGTTYVYMTYGMYYCLNISSEGAGAAVLIRALEPLVGANVMEKFRTEKNKSKRVPKPHELCNGPSKLCIAMDITKHNMNKIDLTSLENEKIWLEDDPEFDIKNVNIIHCARIGIGRAEEWTFKPLRYYIYGNPCVSKRNKAAESLLKFDKPD